MKNKYIPSSLLALIAVPLLAHSTFNAGPNLSHPFYFGVTGGYGSTTWEGLVPPNDKQNSATAISTPIEVKEGGGTWGLFAGYELLPYLAVEASYQHFPDAHVTFDEDSLFTFEHDGQTLLITHTETVGISAKIMMYIPRTYIRLYSSVGAADVHRYDNVADHWRLSPSFGVGFNYNFTDRIMGELGANYTSGYGESELRPAEDFVPFLYSVFLRLAVRL